MFADVLLVFADIRGDSVETKENLRLLTTWGRIFWGKHEFFADGCTWLLPGSKWPRTRHREGGGCFASCTFCRMCRLFGSAGTIGIYAGKETIVFGIGDRMTKKSQVAEKDRNRVKTAHKAIEDQFRLDTSWIDGSGDGSAD